MSKIVWMLNWENVNQDYMMSLANEMFTEWVISWLDVTDNGATITVWAGKAMIEVTRALVWETFKIWFELTEDETISKVDGTVVVRIDTTKVQDWSSIDSVGSNVATVEIGSSFGSDFTLTLATIASSTVTDARWYCKLKLTNDWASYVGLGLNGDWEIEANDL